MDQDIHLFWSLVWRVTELSQKALEVLEADAVLSDSGNLLLQRWAVVDKLNEVSYSGPLFVLLSLSLSFSLIKSFGADLWLFQALTLARFWSCLLTAFFIIKSDRVYLKDFENICFWEQGMSISRGSVEIIKVQIFCRVLLGSGFWLLPVVL